ncbi:hypothetical protein [Fimbriiglobus ruber]|uniref:Uncharacterized protein n=1 Tax=Fimbriiglobus ruber TaxID=1908690 RepID=A0A225E1I9_9BACT|nr:hypothetical protein [Fimbriiglobus ruber]OWK43886.1 hypothetical protein FRUB_03485 [Fimbriiglobus ruber]
MTANYQQWFSARFVAATFAAGVALAGSPAWGQTDDPLARVKALRKVADEKAEYTVRDAIREADKIAKASPTTAVRNLMQVQLTLDLSTEVSSEKRKELVTLLESKVAVIQGRAPAAAVRDPKTLAVKEAERKQAEAYKAETKDVSDGIAEVEKLYALNRMPQAKVKIAELVRKYPTNPSVLALNGQDVQLDRVTAAHDLAKLMEDRINHQMNDVAMSAVPTNRDMEFPKDFQAKTERLVKLERKLLTPEDEAILKALQQPVKSGITNGPFEETLQTLSNLIDKPIYIDKKSLEDAGLDMKKPVTMPANVSARTALRAVLQAQGLTFIIKDKAIQVVTLEVARNSLVTRAYYMGDLVAALGPFGNATQFGPLLDAQQTALNAQFMMDSVKQSIDPLSWREKGGTSTIVFHYPSLSIIVSAPSEVHADLGSRLLRRGP